MSIKNVWYRTYQLGQALASYCVYWPKAKPVTGVGCRKEIPELLKNANVSKVMVVTGKHVGKSIAPEILEDISKAGIEYCHYSKVEANPSTNTVYEIRDLYNSENCNGFLAIGGGSPMDAAKAAGCLVVRPKKSLGDMAGLLKVMKKLPPFIAVPTTSGTGSETTMAAVITDSKTHHKYAIMDMHIVPHVAVMDPELTEKMPDKVTSTTGMDALTHAVEAYLCINNYTKESRRFAEEATVLIFEWLEEAYRNPHNLEARAKMLEAAYKAGFTFSRSGVGNVHAIAHTLGGLYGVAHGLANAVILPIVLEDYGEKAYKDLARLAEITGVKTEGSNEDKAKAFIEEIYAMNERMGIPKTIDVIREEDIPQMVSWALAEANPIYPVPVIYDRERCEKVIRRIMGQ